MSASTAAGSGDGGDGTGPADDGAVVVLGSTSGIGREVARHFVERGREVVVTGRDRARAEAVAGELGGGARGLAVDLADPDAISDALAEIGAVDHLVITAIDRDENTVRGYDLDGARHLVTLKLVGYTQAIHTLLDRMHDETSIVLYGGLAKERPYPGSTTVTTVNGGVTAMVRTLGVELAPIRVNAIHPAVVGDSPYWVDKPAEVLDGLRSRTPLGRLVSMADIVHATVFLLENRAVTGTNLHVDGGWLLT